MAKPLVQSTGRRKSSVARVRLYEGSGSFKLNERSLDNYFPQPALRMRVMEPLKVAEAEGRYDPELATYTLTLRQSVGEGEDGAPMPIPVAMGLIGRAGDDLPLRLSGEAAAAAETTRVLLLDRAEQSFVFVDVEEAPVPSVLGMVGSGWCFGIKRRCSCPNRSIRRRARPTMPSGPAWPSEVRCSGTTSRLRCRRPSSTTPRPWCSRRCGTSCGPARSPMMP